MDHFGEILATLVLFALVFCLFLYFKGVYRPTSEDRSVTGNFIWDYYWGVELHPALFGVNLKQLINCRLSMMGWSIIVCAFALKQAELTGHISNAMLVSVAITVVYLFKFFWWESGYFTSLDIMHDRFGYYICWGVLAWVPAVYALTAQYLVLRPHDWPWPVAVAIFLLGIGAIYVNYAADAQRQRVRATGGATTVWGRAPELIRARYSTADGKHHDSLLLASGWWGVARHFHYVPEITLALAWSLPAGFTQLRAVRLCDVLDDPAARPRHARRQALPQEIRRVLGRVPGARAVEGRAGDLLKRNTIRDTDRTGGRGVQAEGISDHDGGEDRSSEKGIEVISAGAVYAVHHRADASARIASPLDRRRNARRHAAVVRAGARVFWVADDGGRGGPIAD